MQKHAKFLSSGGSAPRPPCLRRLGALPPDPQPPEAGDFAFRPPLASGGWGLRPPNTAPPLRIPGYAPANASASLICTEIARLPTSLLFFPAQIYWAPPIKIPSMIKNYNNLAKRWLVAFFFSNHPHNSN